jgi:hypothetical protein
LGREINSEAVGSLTQTKVVWAHSILCSSWLEHNNFIITKMAALVLKFTILVLITSASLLQSLFVVATNRNTRHAGESMSNQYKCDSYDFL